MDFCVCAAVFDHTVPGTLFLTHSSRAPDFAAQDHAQARDLDVTLAADRRLSQNHMSKRMYYVTESRSRFVSFLLTWKEKLVHASVPECVPAPSQILNHRSVSVRKWLLQFSNARNSESGRRSADWLTAYFICSRDSVFAEFLKLVYVKQNIGQIFIWYHHGKLSHAAFNKNL